MEGFPVLPNSQPKTEVEISQEDFHLFHSIDRRLYLILVVDLLRDPVEAMKIMALWLERVGFFNLVKRILEFPIILINNLAKEANICLTIIDNPRSLLLTSEAGKIPLTQNVVQKNFSLQFLQMNQTLAKFGVENVQSTTCRRAFNDLMQQAILRKEAQRIADRQQQLLENELEMLSNMFGNNVVPADERTIFITFSKGYPVAEWEVRDFFIKKFGECIESFHMQEVRNMEYHSLNARIVLFRDDIIHVILNGASKVKYKINGKYVWMRKFIPMKIKSVTGKSSQQNHNNVVA
ncbi:uncharacterized protein LOC141673139 [Apium graveolens]|uniref:uncharacterized protein LOC141673139 n=1 Tax=Apium graveolens TaxID=4045 RepID=UPI003D7A133E